MAVGGFPLVGFLCKKLLVGQMPLPLCSRKANFLGWEFLEQISSLIRSSLLKIVQPFLSVAEGLYRTSPQLTRQRVFHGCTT